MRKRPSFDKKYTCVTFESDLAQVCGCDKGEDQLVLDRPMTAGEISEHFTAIGIRDGWLNADGSDEEGRRVEAYRGKRNAVVGMGGIPDFGDDEGE